jgi:hypothetical protein
MAIPAGATRVRLKTVPQRGQLLALGDRREGPRLGGPFALSDGTMRHPQWSA